jgi:phospholipase C
MTTSGFGRRLRHGAVVTAPILGLVGGQTSAAFAGGFGPSRNDGATKTPLKHVLIIIGENRTFDHVFATYKPHDPNETISNLRSKGIVNADGTPGPNYARALQMQASDYDSYQLSPPSTPYTVLPPAMIGRPSTPYGCQAINITTGASCDSTTNETAVEKVENGLAENFVKYLLTGGTQGITYPGPDTRVQ